MAPASNEYVPGTCNIGKAEIRRRWAIGWIGLTFGLLLWAALALSEVSRGWRLLVFLPATFAAIGFLQAAWHFCARFGLGGVFNFGPNVGETDTVEMAEYRRKDRRKALQIIGLSLAIGAAVAAAAFLLPV